MGAASADDSGCTLANLRIAYYSLEDVGRALGVTDENEIGLVTCRSIPIMALRIRRAFLVVLDKESTCNITCS